MPSSLQAFKPSSLRAFNPSNPPGHLSSKTSKRQIELEADARPDAQYHGRAVFRGARLITERAAPSVLLRALALLSERHADGGDAW